MQAGHLRDRVTIQQATTVADGQGGQTVTWATLATVWASVMPTRASERIQAAAIGAQQDYDVVIRYRGDVSPAMRLSWTPFKVDSAKTLEVHRVQPYQGRRDFEQLDCAEVI